MRTLIKKLNRPAIQLFTRLLRKRSRPLHGPATKVVLVFPSGRGSVGDDAMALAITAQLRQRGCTHISLISIVPGQSWNDLPFVDEIVDLPNTPWGWMRCIRFLARHDSVGVIGADVLDGHYSPSRSIARLELAGIAARLGLRATLLGFSYRANPEAGSLETLQKVGPEVTVLSRDPLSRERVHKLANVDPTQVADLAFLLQPERGSTRFKEFSGWLSQSRSERRFVLGINCNIQSIEPADRTSIDRLVTSHAQAISVFVHSHPDVGIVLVPHDSRGSDSDEVVCNRIYDLLTEEAKERTFRIETAWSAPELKAVAAELDAAVTGRMHFAIACLGSGTPAVGFEYQDKFSGLYDFFSLGELCRPSTESLDENTLGALMETLHANAPAFGQAVRDRLPHVQDLARRNISALLGED